MFGLSWSEIIIIAVVALVVVGPNDLPRAMRTAARWVRAGQKLAREFQTHVDDLVREAELEELRDKVKAAASEPVSSHIGSLIDPEGELKEALKAPDAFAAPTIAEPTAQPAAEPAPTLPAGPHPAEEIAAPVPEPTGAPHGG